MNLKSLLIVGGGLLTAFGVLQWFRHDFEVSSLFLAGAGILVSLAGCLGSRAVRPKAKRRLDVKGSIINSSIQSSAPSRVDVDDEIRVGRDVRQSHISQKIDDGKQEAR